MKKTRSLIHTILSLVLLSGILQSSLALAVGSVQLSTETLERISRVPEFKFIQDEAEKMGVKVYLFGGTASAFAHYVRWDLEREGGDVKYQSERFDYDFTNIYRGNQDLDLVVDGTIEQAQELQRILQTEYPHFVGNRTAWEVRLLRTRIGDKLPLLGDEDFKNQHTDTNSTGMLAVNPDLNDIVYRDLMDWDNPKSEFLNDISAAQIKYLFSDLHETTSRFQEGKNPSVLSAIRFLAKLTQYEVTARPQDLKRIKQIIAKQDFSKLSYYGKQKAEEFGLKALLNAPDVEYAWDLLDETGLRKKLISIGGDHTQQNTLSWWMSKEPLRSKPVGEGKGKTVKELFGDQELIVSHETNSFIAYENITRSAKGRANVFISRSGAAGEMAAVGDGFYTKVGMKGARGTGLTIRFKLAPNAREGTDFTKSGDYYVILNKNALTLVQENLDIDLIDFFKLILIGELSESDKGVFEKFERKFKRTSLAQLNIKEVVEFISSDDFPHNSNSERVLKVWFSLSFSVDSPDLVKNLIEKGHFSGLSSYVFSQRHWLESQTKLFEVFFNKIIESSDFLVSIFTQDVLIQDFFLEHPHYIEQAIDKFDRSQLSALVSRVLKRPEWFSFDHLYRKALKRADSNTLDALAYVFDKNYWIENHPDLVESFLEAGDKRRDLYSLFPLGLKVKPVSLMLKAFQKNPAPIEINKFVRNVLVDEGWEHHPEILEFLIENEVGLVEFTKTALYKNPGWLKHDKLIQKLIQKFIAKGMKLKSFVDNAVFARHSLMASVFDQGEIPIWLPDLIQHDASAVQLAKRVADAFSMEDFRQDYIPYLLKNPKTHPILAKGLYKLSSVEKATNLLDQIFEEGHAHAEIIRYVLSKEKFLHREDLLNFYLTKPEHSGQVLKYVLSKKFWSDREDLIEKILSLPGPVPLELVKHVLNKPHYAHREGWLKKVLENPEKFKEWIAENRKPGSQNSAGLMCRELLN